MKRPAWRKFAWPSEALAMRGIDGTARAARITIGMIRRRARIMVRSLIAALLIYACGHPSLAAYRPSAFDRPLRDMRTEISRVVADGRRTLGQIKEARSFQGLRDTSNRMTLLLRSL